MKIIIAENAGFCFGVEHAFEKIIEIAQVNEKSVTTLGPLIHNPQTIDLLKDEYNVITVENPDEVLNGVVVIRTHGVSPDVIRNLKAREIEVVNATCPYVMRTQRFAEKLYKEGRFVVIIGDPIHPEVISILGYAKGDGAIIQTFNDVAGLPDEREFGIVIQSTFISEKADSIVREIKKKQRDSVVYNTICYVTQNRQSEAKELAKICDFVLVIGGRNSANTEKLRQLAVLEGAKKVQKIETIDDIDFSDFENIKQLGILAGASTPSWVIDKIVDAIQKNFPGSEIINHHPTSKISAPHIDFA